MNRFEGQFLICLFLEDPEPNDSFLAWPLHLTLVPWFKIPEPALPATNQSIAELLTQPMVLDGTKSARLGRRQVPITLVDDKSGHLKQLHRQLLNIITEAGGKVTAKGHLEDNFSPHVTITRSGHVLPPRSNLKCTLAGLVQKRPGPTPNYVYNLIALSK